MILVDTAVWVDHLRGAPGAARLVPLLRDGEVATHPFVLGELAVGSLGTSRSRFLADLRLLPSLELLPEESVHAVVEGHALAGSGLGWVDAHLLAAVLGSRNRLWTRDRALARAAADLGVAF